MQNKKGFALSYHLLMWIPKIVFTIVVFVMTFGLIIAYIVTTVNVNAPEALIVMHRLQFSEKSFIHADKETLRVYPGVISNENYLGSNRLAKALQFPETAMAVRVEKENTPIFLEEDKYLKEWRPLAVVAGSLTGPGVIMPYRESRHNSVKGGYGVKTVTVVLMQSG